MVTDLSDSSKTTFAQTYFTVYQHIAVDYQKIIQHPAI